ncbi:hypothetical protein [Priestia megaterium]|uniref:hypothetical protein n=1 Tax=Priestia megaterium TaxID=1404 RepID=UPI00211C3D7D|nr:hypothetical protein [Priestia megaterium]
MTNLPQYKENFKYSNVGNVVGTLVYAKQMESQDGNPFGHEFLINAKGYGSINVRVPSLEKSNYAMNNYNVADKPRVRMGLTSLSQFVTQQGKVYTNVTSFVEMSDAKRVDGSDMPDIIAGRIGGEVFDIKQEGSAIKFRIISYPLDRDGNRSKLRNGNFVNPDVVAVEIHEPAVIQEFTQKVQNGSNVEVGYKYVNKDDITYDDYGFAVGSGNRIERVECGKLVVHGGNGTPNPQGSPQGNFQGGTPFNQQQQQQGGNPFGGGQSNQGAPNPFANQQQGQQQQQGNPFANQGQQQNQQQGNPFANQGQQNNQGQQGNPFAGAEIIDQGDHLQQQANQIFGNNGQGNGFQFGN